ncbi:MAG: hypothetical protein H8E66_19680 [Planctomycetes bacterium]|nr:hypothetical protein [Planctomycetota bacterium]
MSESDLREAQFSGSAETPELEDYHPISPLTIGACLAACASLLAVIHPILWVVPVVAVVLSTCAIVRVSSAHSRYSGRTAAVFALCGAVLIGAYAPARVLSRDRLLYARSQEKAAEWIKLIQEGRVQEAHQLSLSESARFRGPESLASHYRALPPIHGSSTEDVMRESMGGPRAGEQLRMFVSEPVVAKLLAFGDRAQIEHLENGTIGYDYGDVTVVQVFRASGVVGGGSESIDFLIRTSRREGKNLGSWKVGALQLRE